MLFNNREIIINGTSFYYHKWHQKRYIFFIQEFLNRYKSPKCNFLRYQVLAAIPKLLREKAIQTSLDKHKFEKDNFILPLSPTVSINLLKMKSEDFYWLFMSNSVTKATGPRNWEHEIQLINLNWSCYFSKWKVICKENKLREFYYKSLHRIVATKKELYHLGIESKRKNAYIAREARSYFYLLPSFQVFFQSRFGMVQQRTCHFLFTLHLIILIWKI